MKKLEYRFEQLGGCYEDTNQQNIIFIGWETILQAKHYPPFCIPDVWELGSKYPLGMSWTLVEEVDGIKLFKKKMFDEETSCYYDSFYFYSKEGVREIELEALYED